MLNETQTMALYGGAIALSDCVRETERWRSQTVCHMSDMVSTISSSGLIDSL